MTEKEKLQKLLQELVVAICSTVNEGLRTKTLQPRYEPYFRWKLTEFEYGDTGIKKKSAKGEELLKPYWGRATLDVHREISKLSVYNHMLKAISEGYGIDEVQCGYHLERLITKIAWNTLEGKVKTPTDLSKYTISFLKDLNEEKQEYRAEVHLRGLVLQPDSIQLDDNARLRKPERKDFEREVPIIFPSRGAMSLEDPTAFLHTRINTTKGAIALQNEIDREIAMLRLFRVGAVQDLQYTMDTDSVVDFAPGRLTRGKLLGPDKYLITVKDVKPLKKFWVNMTKVELPASVYSGNQKEPDELSIAYDRYNDSLDTHLLEKRISSAVMGLEALYLSPSERQELTFKLSMRVGKLLSQIGCNAEKVRKELTHAYDIRSTYVHGKTLTQKQKNRHEKEVGELGQFSKVVMDYLRASIVVLLRRPSKTSLIQKLDDSFLDSKKEEEIRKLLFMPYEKERLNAAG